MISVPKSITDKVLGQAILNKDITPASKVDDDEELKAAIRNKIFSWVAIGCSILGGIWSVVQALGFYYGWWCRNL